MSSSIWSSTTYKPYSPTQAPSPEPPQLLWLPDLALPPIGSATIYTITTPTTINPQRRQTYSDHVNMPNQVKVNPMTNLNNLKNLIA